MTPAGEAAHGADLRREGRPPVICPDLDLCWSDGRCALDPAERFAAARNGGVPDRRARGDESYPVTSSLWEKLLDVPLTLQWSRDKVYRACLMFAQNNHQTRHLAKILIHLVWSLQESQSNSTVTSTVSSKAVNAAYISSIFLKYFIENAKIHNFEDLYLEIGEGETKPENFPKDENIPQFVMRSVLSFISESDVSPQSCLVHYELLNFMFVAMSTQLRSGPMPGPDDAHPFIDAAMVQEGALISSVVRRLLINYITRPRISFNDSSYPILTEEMQPGVLQRFGSAAESAEDDQMVWHCSLLYVSLITLPMITRRSILQFALVSPLAQKKRDIMNVQTEAVCSLMKFHYTWGVIHSADGSRSLLADNSLLVLLVLIHYRRCVLMDGSINNYAVADAAPNVPSKDGSYFSSNPYCKALENARDIEFDRVDVEGNAQTGPLVRLPFASLFDTLGMCLSDENSALLLYSLVYGNSDFLEYVFVRTDLDTLLMPILETLYNASRRTSNQIYMLLIILLVLSQDSSFNASIHKLVLPSVPWYQERRLHNTSLGSLMVVILIRTVMYNMSKLRDVYLHTNCLATLANMAPHVHRLSGYASQRLVSLFDMLGRKYTKLVEIKQGKGPLSKGDQVEGGIIPDDVSAELQIYTDFLRIVLEIVNAILTYALPRNPEVVYAIMHRQEVFQPFRDHSRFSELLENIYTVLDFFNSRMDTQRVDDEWSVDKVLEIIIINCRSWHGDGMKMFNQLKFTYEQESHHEEFFIPYVWQLVLSTSFEMPFGVVSTPKMANGVMWIYIVTWPQKGQERRTEILRLSNSRVQTCFHLPRMVLDPLLIQQFPSFCYRFSWLPSVECSLPADKCGKPVDASPPPASVALETHRLSRYGVRNGPRQNFV